MQNRVPVVNVSLAGDNNALMALAVQRASQRGTVLIGFAPHLNLVDGRGKPGAEVGLMPLTLEKNRYIPVPIFIKHGAPFDLQLTPLPRVGA